MKITAPAETGDESPVTSFVQLERYNAIRLVQIVHASLSSLSKVIRGTALLDAEVQALAGSLLKQEVSDTKLVNFTRALLASFIVSRFIPRFPCRGAAVWKAPKILFTGYEPWSPRHLLWVPGWRSATRILC